MSTGAGLAFLSNSQQTLTQGAELKQSTDFSFVKNIWNGTCIPNL
jgi:hypothetical protein